MWPFSRSSGPPDVEKLKKKKDAKGLLRALAYGEERKVREGENSKWVDAEVIRVELGVIEALAEIGATSSIAEVLRVLQEPRGFHASTFVLSYEKDPANPYALALSKFGEPAVPHLAGMLKTKGTWLPCAAALALGHMGPAAAAAEPALIEVVRHCGNQGVSLTAATLWALGQVAASPEAAEALVAVLAGNSQISETNNRALQVLASGRFGQAATDALAKVVQEHEHDMRVSSAGQRAALALCLLKDERGMKAALPLLPSSRGDSLFPADKHFLSALGNFDDPAVREHLRKTLDIFVAAMEKYGQHSELPFDNAFQTALGLAQLKDNAALQFLREALRKGNLGKYYDSLLEMTYDQLAARALA